MRASASGGFGGYKLLADFFLSPSSFRDIAFCEEREEGKEAFDTDFFSVSLYGRALSYTVF